MANEESGIVSELLDDFYAECDEHLSSIRQNLATLEAFQGRTLPADEPTVAALFRSFHSLKGICAIVGLRPAEQLAHSCEDYLRAISQEERQLTSTGYDALTAGVQRLEQIVGAHRAKQSLPDSSQQLAQLAAVASAVDQPVVSERPSTAPAGNRLQPPRTSAEDKVRAAMAEGRTVWICTFTPSAVLDQRGVNVSQIRSRLGQIGTILDGSPKVGAGSITFQFLVATRETEVDWGAWHADGVTAVPYTAAQADQPVAVPEVSAPHTPFLAPSHVVRVDLARLDDLMRIAGDLVVYRARLEQQIEIIRTSQGGNVSGLREVDSSLTRSIRDLREAIMRVRLVPAAEVFARLPFVARDIARETSKKVRVTTSGQETQVDKYIVERMKDPLLHLVRNAVSHGVETPAERREAGKDETATISVAAATAGDVVVIRISDDGRGIDREAVRQRAVQVGIAVPAILDDVTLLDIISSPGFSTRDYADLASGRGVGMAVVANTIRELGGAMTLESRMN
jgi:two-component system chemotaxis sensor kinase CheA